MEGDRALPQLTQLSLEVHTSDSGARSLAVSFLVSVQDTLREDFEAAAHNAVLAHAHHNGHMPIGPILILTETWTPPEQAPLKEGKTLMRSFDDFALEQQGLAGNIVKVSADVELGLSLD